MTFIRPIEFSGIVQRTNELSNVKQQQDQKPVQDQSNIQQNVQKGIEHTTKEVAKKDNADYAQQRYDAKEKGKGQYTRQEQKRKQEQPQEKVVKKVTSGFDVKI